MRMCLYKVKFFKYLLNFCPLVQYLCYLIRFNSIIKRENLLPVFCFFALLIQDVSLVLNVFISISSNFVKLMKKVFFFAYTMINIV
ncbi:hypothetical protein BpHYR1_016959 [Brachionus plicatilis]|uniref:Uncharacterized protein n=1 Tax=Brachionus plicatilis TaxID=10195 RepID=A0A3M7SRP7_BRAPC|nr:hypothetical protein BpHYR1_016959 [Brachionus plicatilis]